MPVLHTSRTSVRLSRGGTSACSSSLSTPCLERHTANPERVDHKTYLLTYQYTYTYLLPRLLRGAGPLTLPGGIGYQYTYLLTYPGISHHSTSAKTILEALDHLGLLAY